MERNASAVPAATIRELARLRYQIRRFLRFSERAARAAGLTPQQHQLLLGVAGHTGRGWATISELSEFLQKRHNAVVGLVNRAHRAGLVSKRPIARDLRLVRVQLTSRGRKVLGDLSALHRREIGNLQALGNLAFRSPVSPKRSEGPAKPKVKARRPSHGSVW
jgi:DNA-binding MarR family transcriptional regulator